MRKVIFLLFSVLISFGLNGQSSGEIKATVTDKQTGDSIAYCTAFVLKPDSLRKTGVNSDTKGLCRFKQIPAGIYTLVFSYPGYKTDTIYGIVVKANGTTYMSVKLSPLTYSDPDYIIEPGKKKNLHKKTPAKNTKRNPVIEGKIIDSETKETIPFAILLANGPGEKKCGVISDPDGRFKLELPTAGKYLLECRIIGYHSEIIPLIADSFKQYSFEISLCQTGVELIEITLPPHRRGGRMKTDTVSGADTVYIITGGIPDDIYRDTTKPKISLTIDSFKLYHIRPLAGYDLAAALFRTGKLYQFNDSLFYFNHGSCPHYVLYVKHENKLIQYTAYDRAYPAEFEFRKRGDGYLIKSEKARARLKKYQG